MADRYTAYPDHLKKRIVAVDNFLSDVPKFREWWDSLPDEERARLEALPPDEQKKEIDRLRGLAKPDDNPNPNPENSDDTPPADEETVETLKAKLEKVEQKYRTLQGMSKESGELERMNNLLLSQIKSLQDQIHEIKNKPAEEKKVETKKVNVREALKPHYDKLAEDLAPEIVEKEMQKDEGLFELLESRANQRISEVATKFDGQFKLSKEEQFYTDLDKWGEWKKMWATPEFQDFLSEEADVTGVERIDILKDAFARLDSRTVIRAFDKFKGVTPPPKKNGGDGNIDSAKIKNRVAGPRSSASAPQNPNPNNPNPTKMSPQEARKRLSQMAADYGRGLWKGNKEEYDKEYARLHAIITQGTG